MRRHPDEFRRRVTKNDEPLVSASSRDPWFLAERARKPARRERALWPLTLAALAFAILVLGVNSGIAMPALLADIPWARIFHYQPVSPVDPGDRNGLLHER